MKITNANSTWQSVTTTKDEVWQVHSGSVRVDTDSVSADRLGIILRAASPEEAPPLLSPVWQNDSVAFGAGVTVYYTLHGSNSAIIARVAVTA